MKRILLLLIVMISCQRELSLPDETQLEKNTRIIQGKWKFLSYSDHTGDTFTNALPCYADDTFELLPDKGIISQGNCIEYPGKPRDISFTWNMINDTTVNFGGDTVILEQITASSLKFKRDRPNQPFFRYEYFK